MNIDLKNLTIEKVHNSLINGEYKVRDLVDAYLAIIKEKNERINAYIEIFDDIDDQIKKAEEKFENGTATIMTGIPMAIKDNILIKGKSATSASKILKGYVASYDSTVIENLKNHNAIFLGRTNMDEFAMGSSTETSAYGVTRNPLDEERVPGGSSGGSVAAVSMYGALVALGSETCGSIRQPSAFCGLVGLKPTYGAVSRFGLMAMGSSLDQIGPTAHTVSDAEIVYKTILSYDKNDSTSVKIEERKNRLKKDKKGIIGIPKAFLEGPGIDKKVLDSFWKTIELLKNDGYKVVNIDQPLTPYALAVYYILMPAESSTNLARFDGLRYGDQIKGDNLIDTYKFSRGKGFGIEVRRRMILGAYVLSHGYYDAYYNSALLIRDALTKEIEKAFEDVDFIATPTAPTLPFKLGEKLSDPVSMYLSDVFSAPANLSECPAIAIPTGKTEEGLPTSIQITAPKWCEENLFDIGKDIEKLV
ncbi:TPA: Asp-tRNA(Asn)/Glu-tRNA(Gln) amidotransferase subunit GatA [Candidatus Nomurabacteria bacterium]|nr:MAG: Glutamyl-tRNA(Gln) amidotransferase subunit A [Parcubacteria bacterium RAAC4_OD1_1]HCY26321.1 Asp-tRNA(Asn)/Glu-tRNA(Gln) amidotransferase subunit GatA [Candidatus Nomurabacteria bacterium]